MADQNNASAERKTDRLEAFSDAVLAIAITLPVADLKVPTIKHGESLGAAYAELAPEYLAYALSFVVIGLYWVHSHFSGKIIKKTDHGFNLLTMLFLAAVSLTPFPTRPFVEHFHDPVNNRTAATVYACLLTAPAWVWIARWIYAVKGELIDPRLTPEYVHRLTLKYSITAALSGLGAALAWFVEWRVGWGLTMLLVLSYFAPPMQPQFKPGQEPEDELEEADEESEGNEAK